MGYILCMCKKTVLVFFHDKYQAVWRHWCWFEPFKQLFPGLNDSSILFILYPCECFDQYYDCKKCNDNFIGDGVNDFSVLHVNIRSLNANGESFFVYL